MGALLGALSSPRVPVAPVPHLIHTQCPFLCPGGPGGARDPLVAGVVSSECWEAQGGLRDDGHFEAWWREGRRLGLGFWQGYKPM